MLGGIALIRLFIHLNGYLRTIQQEEYQIIIIEHCMFQHPGDDAPADIIHSLPVVAGSMKPSAPNAASKSSPAICAVAELCGIALI